MRRQIRHIRRKGAARKVLPWIPPERLRLPTPSEQFCQKRRRPSTLPKRIGRGRSLLRSYISFKTYVYSALYQIIKFIRNPRSMYSTYSIFGHPNLHYCTCTSLVVGDACNLIGIHSKHVARIRRKFFNDRPEAGSGARTFIPALLQKSSKTFIPLSGNSRPVSFDGGLRHRF